MKGKLVLVTGGASFIGSHLVDTLLKKGADVRVADDFSSGKLENLEYPLTSNRRGRWVNDKLAVYKGNLKDKSFAKSEFGKNAFRALIDLCRSQEGTRNRK